ncbi:uncharacterized protein BKCO1_3200011 [Diplodia corticola]|uniref:Uncharacterized protein n=1 Tax=Diplodia corticola TaxID=236234 RepID=A0A1J9QZ11_9PEZI|nr:uncharacterized protein BKCO1_3200011 [Diplodia corticola]OJD33226.1 hypothetical protein BKCO1_3200011 [Diplodia corticola]
MSARPRTAIMSPPSTLSARAGVDSLAIPSQAPRFRANRQPSSGSSNLRLPSLPRFHPANFPSSSSSAATTPSTNPNSPQPPPSPRSQQKQYSEAQQQLYMYQRELIANATRNMATGSKPASPRLNPLGSPGPVTPLELEGQGGDYLTAGAKSAGGLCDSRNDLVEKLLQDEVRRVGQMSPGRPTSVGSY